MMSIKNKCWNYAKPVVKQIWVFSLINGLLASIVFASANSHFAFEGRWAFDEDASDSQQKIIRRLEKQLAIQESFQYPQKTAARNHKASKVGVDIIGSAPDFLFSQSDLQIQVVDGKVTLSQTKKHRKINLHGGGKSFSLKQFDRDTLTTVASVKDDKLFIDSTTSGGLFIGEVFYVDEKNRLIQQLHINDGIHESLYLQRVYQTCTNTCKKN